jgi:mannose-6-phosphate isomerase-like protein (cupin superfamily)
MQIVLMALIPGEDIPKEVHDGTQFIRVEAGTGIAIVDGRRYMLKDGISLTIPAGAKHYIKNNSKDNKALKLYSIYTPPEHPEGLKQVNQPL